jgi:hypothetical protein
MRRVGSRISEHLAGQVDSQQLAVDSQLLSFERLPDRVLVFPVNCGLLTVDLHFRRRL